MPKAFDIRSRIEGIREDLAHLCRPELRLVERDHKRIARKVEILESLQRKLAEKATKKADRYIEISRRALKGAREQAEEQSP